VSTETVPPNFIMDDRDLTQLIVLSFVERRFEISISTENENFRNNIIPMSAGSKTNPGGYVVQL
jgi:2-iminoacetate synthase